MFTARCKRIPATLLGERINPNGDLEKRIKGGSLLNGMNPTLGEDRRILVARGNVSKTTMTEMNKWSNTWTENVQYDKLILWLRRRGSIRIIFTIICTIYCYLIETDNPMTHVQKPVLAQWQKRNRKPILFSLECIFKTMQHWPISCWLRPQTAFTSFADKGLLCHPNKHMAPVVLRWCGSGYPASPSYGLCGHRWLSCRADFRCQAHYIGMKGNRVSFIRYADVRNQVLSYW